MAAVQEQVRATMHLHSANVAEHGNQREAQQSKHRRGSTVLNRITLAFCCVVSFASVWFVATESAAVDRSSYQNTLLQQKISQQDATNAALGSQVDQLKQPSRILNAALQYHMVVKNPVMIPSSSVSLK